MDASDSSEGTPAATQQTEVGSSSNQPSSQTPQTEATPTNIAVDGEDKQKGKVRSAVWNSFTRIDENFARCNHCKSKYAAQHNTHGTSGLWKHLNRCPRNPDKKKDKGQQTLMLPPSKPGVESNLVGYTYSYAKLRRALVEWIIKDEQAFRAVEGSGFVALMQVAEPRFKVPSRMTIYRDMLELYLEEKNNLKTYFLTSKQRVSLTTDTWTSPNNFNFMCVTVHFIDENWKLQKRIIMFRQVDGHTGVAIGEMLEKCLLEWGLEDVFGVTLDNVSANKVAIDYLKKSVIGWTNSATRAKYLHVRCAAHVLALVVRDAVRLFNPSIRRIRSVVKYILGSPGRLSKFRQCAALEKIDCKKGLILDVYTRWNSTYLMLNGSERYEKVIKRLERYDKEFQKKFIFEEVKDNVLPTDEDVDRAIVEDTSEELAQDIEEEEEFEDTEDEEEVEDPRGKNKAKTKKKKPRLHAPYEEDWKYARGLVKCLKVFFDATVRFSASEQVTTHTFLWELLLIHEQLVDFRNNAASDPFIARMSRLMLAKYHKYWGVYESMNSAMFFAHLLDPREKEKGLEFTLNCLYENNQFEVERVMRKVKREFKELFEEYKSVYSVHEEGSSSFTQVRADTVCDSPEQGLLARIQSRKRRHWQNPSCVEESRTTELDRYLMDLADGHEDDMFDILDWWKGNASRYKILSFMARDILAMPVSSVASESAFSTGKRVLTQWRASLSTRTVEALLCTQSWLQKPIALDLLADYVPDDNADDEYAILGPLSDPLDS